jgi:hypothetical protein
MAPPRTFDYDKLEQLIISHPDWPYALLADELTEDNRKQDPASPRIKPDSVRRVVSQYRSEWEDRGTRMPERGVMHELSPPTGTVPASHRMATELRYLREVSAEQNSEAPVGDSGRARRRQALRWAERLRENREIVDLTSQGIPVVRPAGAAELDKNGNLIELAAWALPGWEPPARRNGRGRG